MSRYIASTEGVKIFKSFNLPTFLPRPLSFGRVPEDGKVDKIKNWGPCQDLTDVQSFLGTSGILRIYIRNYSLIARPLVNLTWKDVEFYWGPEQEAAQHALKEAIIHSPALRPIDYKSGAQVILAVDTSAEAVGYALFQEDPDNPKQRYPSCFGSIALNKTESNYSQPKLKLYGLYRALKEAAIWIIAVKNLTVEVDATAIKGMINNPDMNPSAVINRWVAGILLFDFELVHVPGITHGPDGLSRRRPQPGNPPPQGDDPNWIDKYYGFLHTIKPYPDNPIPSSTPIDIPHDRKVLAADARLDQVQKFLSDLSQPPDLSDDQLQTFANYASEFFLKDDELWK
ncbi:uncharacterized protein ARMOST_04506 [Armillaria ostoyae]|uniref:Reverse transcriptase/retrotransposon-derived protein RNase H-like domain-containing protein n=1 Tax=Armillaria ostoyae TaxID=47428 RepID=A0A284QXH0_ARMOS|nr:uncharacterized protein ARMOST_04506 [Armillaria ostoyae]